MVKTSVTEISTHKKIYTIQFSPGPKLCGPQKKTIKHSTLNTHTQKAFKLRNEEKKEKKLSELFQFLFVVNLAFLVQRQRKKKEKQFQIRKRTRK